MYSCCKSDSRSLCHCFWKQCSTIVCKRVDAPHTFAIETSYCLVRYLTNTELHQNYSRAFFSGYTILLPRTGIWYLSFFQNLEEGERDGDSCESVSPFSTSDLLVRVFHLCPVLWFFHQHTAPCFFLRWRTDSGNRASWAGVISSSSTRTTCKSELRLFLVSIFEDLIHIRQIVSESSCRSISPFKGGVVRLNTAVCCGIILLHLCQYMICKNMISPFPYLERALKQHSVHRWHVLQLLPGISIELIADIRAHNATAVTGASFTFTAAFSAFRNVVIITAGAACVSFGAESGGGVEQKDTATGLYVFFNRVHQSCRRKQRVKRKSRDLATCKGCWNIIFRGSFIHLFLKWNVKFKEKQ